MNVMFEKWTVFYGELNEPTADSPDYNLGRADRLELTVPPTALYYL